MSIEDKECPICFEEYSNKKNITSFKIEPCNHVCCNGCINNILFNCFYCRSTIRNHPIPFEDRVQQQRINEGIDDSSEEIDLSVAFRRRCNLSMDLVYFLINYCDCTLSDINADSSINYVTRKIFTYAKDKNYIHPNDRRYILVSPELRTLLINNDREIEKIEEGENGVINSYITNQRVFLLLYRRRHFESGVRYI